MKAKAIIFTGMALGLLGLAAPLQLRADNLSDQRDAQPSSRGWLAQTATGFSTCNAASNVSSAGAAGSDLSGQTNAGQYSPPPNQAPPPPADRASDLIGMKVENPSHQTLGKVKDVVVDLQSGRISYVVVEKAGRTHDTGKYAAVPPSALTPSPDMKHLILNTDKAKFQASQGFSRNNYPPPGEPAFGAQPGEQQQEIIIVPVVPSSPGQDQTPNPDQDQNSDQGPKIHPAPGPDSNQP